ncbi:MAG TPA: ABC transporter permease [Gemmatimonadaceae bacterium]|nr:ABC transporter permease [Gemmatimonadaceae bacterium]
MGALKGIAVRLRALLRPAAADRDLDDEIALHLELETAKNRGLGLNTLEARRRALAAFGGVTRVREEHREARGARWLDETVRDVRIALRGLRRGPGFAVVAVLTIALGIGANTAIFSVLDALLLRPLPYRTPERLVTIWNHWDGNPGGPGSVSPAEFFDYLDRVPALRDLGVYARSTAILGGEGEPVRLPTAFVSAGALRVLGVSPAVGRLIDPAEDVPGGPSAVVLGDGLWRRRFGGDRDIVGRRLVIDGVPATVVGVMPPGFRLPDDLAQTDAAELYLPLRLARDSITIRGSHFLSSVARLAPGTTVEQADAAVAALASRLTQEFPSDYPTKMAFGASVLPLRDSVVGAVRPTLYKLVGAVGFVLLIACVNVANLLLARAESRRGELAVRTALGAARGRLVRQLVVESLVLAVAGGVLGALVAVAGVHTLVALRPPDIPRLDAVSVDGRVLAFTLAASLLTGLLFGVGPALRAARPGNGLALTLRAGGRGAAGEGRRGVRRALVVSEIAIAVVLLLAAGLLTKSFLRLLAVNPGFVVERVLTVPLTLPAEPYAEPARAVAFYRELTDRARVLPGVQAVGAVAGVPLVAERGDLGLEIEGRPVAPGDQKPRADWQVVTPGYFRAIGMRLLRGRGIEATDGPDAPGVVVINETMAHRYWPDGDAIGRRFKLGGGAAPGWVTVVGVVGDVHQAGLGAPVEAEMYLAHAQFRFWGSGAVLRAMTLVARSDGEPTALAGPLRRTIAAMDPTLPVGTFRTMEELRGESVSRPRLLMLLIVTFALVALVIALAGIYGVIAYGVAQRRREFGVRAALGAQPVSIARLVLGEGLRLTVVGIALGLAGGLALARLLGGLLFQVRPADPATAASVAVAVAAVALLACWVPARRATRVDPTTALRTE